MPALEITELDALTLLVMVDNESDILSTGLSASRPRFAERRAPAVGSSRRFGYQARDLCCTRCGSRVYREHYEPIVNPFRK
jgi:hypothetical protein